MPRSYKKSSMHGEAANLPRKGIEAPKPMLLELPRTCRCFSVQRAQSSVCALSCELGDKRGGAGLQVAHTQVKYNWARIII
jgi:hypothetical protein